MKITIPAWKRKPTHELPFRKPVEEMSVGRKRTYLYDGDCRSVKLLVYRSGHCFVEIGSESVLLQRYQAYEFLRTGEWARA